MQTQYRSCNSCKRQQRFVSWEKLEQGKKTETDRDEKTRQKQTSTRDSLFCGTLSGVCDTTLECLSVDVCEIVTERQRSRPNVLRKPTLNVYIAQKSTLSSALQATESCCRPLVPKLCFWFTFFTVRFDRKRNAGNMERKNWRNTTSSHDSRKSLGGPRERAMSPLQDGQGTQRKTEWTWECWQ